MSHAPERPDPARSASAGASGGADAAEERVRVALAVGGVRIAFAGRRRFFDRHVAPLLEAIYVRGHGREPTRPAAPAVPVFQPASPQHFRKFTAQVGENASTVEKRAMAFAFYLWNFERRETFTVEDLAAFFRTVQEEPPETLEALLASLAQGKRWLEARDEGAAWKLTTKGVNYVKNRLLGD